MVVGNSEDDDGWMDELMVIKTMVKMIMVVKTRVVMKRMVTRRMYAYTMMRMYSVMFLYTLSNPSLKRLS